MKPARLIFARSLLLGAALSLAACAQEKKEEPAKEPDAKPGFSITDGRLVLPAVKDNPGVAYFNLENASGGLGVLAGVSVDGVGKAEVHQTAGDSMMKVDRIELAPSTTLKFEPGALHVMLFELAPKLKAGTETEITVTFEGGDKVSAPLKVEAAGSGGGEHDH